MAVTIDGTTGIVAASWTNDIIVLNGTDGSSTDAGDNVVLNGTDGSSTNADSNIIQEEVSRTSNPVAGQQGYNPTLKQMEVYIDNNWEIMAEPFTATGGTITTSGDYTIHTFTSSGVFTPIRGNIVDYLVVGGGGAGLQSSINGTSTYYCAGGAGSPGYPSGSYGDDGIGLVNAANRGHGGTTNEPVNGSSGVVIIRYLT